LTADDYATRVANLITGTGVPLVDATTANCNGGYNLMQAIGGVNLWYGNPDPDSYPDYNPDAERFVDIGEANAFPSAASA
jgi:hypothetical protein